MKDSSFEWYGDLYLIKIGYRVSKVDEFVLVQANKLTGFYTNIDFTVLNRARDRSLDSDQ